MSVYVITAVHNRRAITQRFVETLKGQTFQGSIRLILVDDGSTDGTDKMVLENYPDSTVLYGNGNLWWGGALHKAYKHLMSRGLEDSDVILFANDDSSLGSDYIEKAMRILEANPNALLTGCGYGINTGYFLDGPIHFNLKNGEVTHLSAGSTGNCASTRALCLRYGVFKEIGGFHPALLPHYASDYEYTIRAFRRGHPVISSEQLTYSFSEDTTGDNLHANLTFKKVFSKRSKLNPFYKLVFFLMVAPAYRLPSYVAYQIRHFKRHKRDVGQAV